MAQVQTKNVVVKSNLDTAKGFKINKVAKKIEIALDEAFLAFGAEGKVTLSESAKSGTLNGNITFEEGKLKFPFKDGTTKEVDLASALVDLHVTSATLDNTTLKLTTGDSATVDVDLAPLLSSSLNEVKKEDTNTVQIEGVGTETDKLKANVKVSTTEKNILETKSDGLYATLKLETAELEKLGLEIIELKDAFDENAIQVLVKKQ